MNLTPHFQALREAGVSTVGFQGEDPEELLGEVAKAQKDVGRKIDELESKTSRTAAEEAKLGKLKQAQAELYAIEDKVSEARSDAAETEAPGSGGTVRAASEGGGDKRDPYSLLTPKEKRELQLAQRDAEIAKFKDDGRQRNDADTARDLTLGLTALNAGAGIVGGGGGQFVSSASSGSGGSYFGTATGSGGGFGVAGFGVPGGMLGIASPGGGSGAMGPGDVLFNIGAPMMTSGANGFGEEIRQQNRKLEALINFLLMQILSGNTDAITSALIAVSRKSKGTLILSSVGMISAMKQYDQQQAKISETFQNLQFDAGNPDSMAKFQHQSQNLSMQLNGIAVARQMLMNQMRDVLTMSEEIGNVEKSILDIVGQFKRHYSRFNV